MLDPSFLGPAMSKLLCGDRSRHVHPKDALCASSPIAEVSTNTTVKPEQDQVRNSAILTLRRRSGRLTCELQATWTRIGTVYVLISSLRTMLSGPRTQTTRPFRLRIWINLIYSTTIVALTGRNPGAGDCRKPSERPPS